SGHAFPAAKPPLTRYEDLIDARLARCRLYAVDQFADLLFEFTQADEQIGFEHDEHVAIVFVRIETGTGEHAKRLHDEGKAEALIAAKRQQCTKSRKGWIASRLPIGIDGHSLREHLSKPFAIGQVGAHEGGRPLVENDRPTC